MGKILIVDDSQDLLSMQKLVLEFDSHEVLTAQSAYAALKIIDNGKNFDLLLLDTRMPDWDGMSFLKWLRVHRPTMAHVPAVLMTTVEAPPPNPLAAGFIHKMANADDFAAQVGKFIATSVVS